jgi:ferric-dicitrate binding protein FerR (iron transport regulator)
MSDEEDVTAQLLRLARPPSDPSLERTSRVREAVRLQWQAGRRRRNIRRGAAMLGLALAASIAVVVLMPRGRPGGVEPVEPVLATTERIQGQPLIVRQHERAGIPKPVSASMTIYADDVIQTDHASRLGLTSANNASIRIDRGSLVRFLATDVIEVMAGAVYVSTAAGSHGFEVRTALGSLRDLGTQFEVRLEGPSLRVRVRTGHVEIRHAGAVQTTTGGTEAIVTSSGVKIELIKSYGPAWAWTGSVAPAVLFEGQSLHAFLERSALEEGWTLRYVDADVAGTARRVVLHGSVDGLSPDDALSVALATSGLTHRWADGELLVSRSTAAR